MPAAAAVCQSEACPKQLDHQSAHYNYDGTIRFYTGIIEVPAWKMTVQGAHRPIISKRLFARVQAVLAAHNHGPLERHVYLLHQRVVMAGRNSPLYSTTVKQKNRRYYYCLEKGRRRQYYDADVIDAAVVKQVLQRMAQFKGEPEQVVPRRVRRVAAQMRHEAQERMEDVQHQRQRLLRFATSGRFTEAEVTGEMSRLQIELEAAEREVARADMVEAMHAPLIAGCIASIQAVQSWERLSPEERRDVMSELIDEVEINNQGQVTVVRWSSL